MVVSRFACSLQKLYLIIFQMLQDKLKFNLPFYSSIIIWTFQVFGLIGILFWDSQWFINTTPLCLLIYFGLVISNGTNKNLSFILISFLWGLFAEIIGVQTGVLFGSYMYGETLGLKIFGAPLVIGLNWVTTVIICASIANQLKVPTHFKILISIALMLFLDYFIEPVAPKIDMWSFSGIQHAPLSNYITWALVALPLQYIYHYKKLEFNLPLSVNLYISQLLFFIVLGLAL